MLRYIVFAFVTFQTSEYCEARSNNTYDVILNFYTTSTTVYQPINITTPQQLLTSPGYVSSKPTMFYFMGYKEQVVWDSVQAILRAYLARNDYNIVVGDWTNMNQGNYVFVAVPNVFKVAKEFSKCLNALITAGLAKDRIHLVGHSLGGQLVGLAGNYLRKTYNHTVARITGLDPAGPIFTLGIPHENKNDAVFVDCIHSDGWFNGYQYSGCTVDFYANRGTRFQPGCPFTWQIFGIQPQNPASLCSHSRSWQLWVEALGSPKAFEAKPCTAFKNVQKKSTVINYMGLTTNQKLTGSYCLKTNASSPYGLGAAGVM